MIIIKILALFQNIRDFPDAEVPVNNIFNRIPGFGNTLFFVAIILILWFVVSSLLTFWTYKDIGRTQLTGYIYVPLVFLASFIGLIVYYIVRYSGKCALELDEEACLIEEYKEDNI